MSELRARKTAPPRPSEADKNGEETAGRADMPDTAPQAASSAASSLPPPSRSPSIRAFGRVLLPLALTAIAALVMSKLNGKQYPLRYAVCTYDQSVYVNAHERVDCVVVNRQYVEHTGSLADVRERYGDLDTLGSISPWTAKKRQNRAQIPILSLTSEDQGGEIPGEGQRGGAGLKIYYVNRGQAVYPGLTDAHGHILEYGRSLTQVSLHGAASIGEVVSRIVHFIDKLPAEHKNDLNRIIEGNGFDQTKYPGQQFPTAADLDVPELKGRKVFLVRVDLHACWVSPSLLQDVELPDHIPGGIILRDAQGEPTGVFLDTAYEWIMARLPRPTDKDRAEYLHNAANALLEKGVTGVHDAAASLEAVAFYKRLDERNMLPIKIYAMVACPVLDEYCGDDVERYEGPKLTVRSVKLFLDGALGSWGAAMLEPYADNPSERGIARMSLEKTYELASSWTKKGFQVNTHAIGDAANRLVVDVYERLLQERGEADNKQLRYRIEHAQILSKEYIERAGKLGLIASVQPTHCTSDMGYAESRLGPERVLGAYAWQSLLGAGAPLALGSDFPVESVNPFYGLHSAVTRLNATNASPHGPRGWYPQEQLTRAQAFEGFTSAAAWAGFQEDKVGTLKRGMRADLIVTDRDWMRVVDARKIRETQVLATIVDGRVVHGKL